ncbi:MAG: alpha-amylase family glycosyl hydrolase [Verrucomicrobiia bacterium]
MTGFFKRIGILIFVIAATLFCRVPLYAEAMLQLFNLSWKEVIEKIPEIAEAGYTSLWLPPPGKGSSGAYSVGYDLFDPFDLGDKDQRGSVRTRYGTKDELIKLVEIAHRFGLRVYFDNIMNHRGFDVPGYDVNTPTNLYPGLAPQDFHLQITAQGFYRNTSNIRDYSSVWQVWNLSLGGLVDIAQENPNANFGVYEGAQAQKISFVRQPRNPEYYDFHPTKGRVGFGNVTQSDLDANPNFYKEDVNTYLIRSVRWFLDTTKCDGFRLDAVKHVPDYFFGKQSGSDKDTSDAGYIGNIQRQYNITHGFTDVNHRDSNFDTERSRDDALVFGEHLGEPPGYGGYIDAGMRLLDNPLRNYLNSVLGNPSATLAGLDGRDFGGFAASVRVMHAQSHDNDYAARRELQNAYYFMREGIPLIYSDGYNKSDSCNNCGGPFPRHANAPYLGEFGDNKMPDLAWLHHQLARGGTRPRWSDNDIVAFERYDYREGSSSNPQDQTTVLFVMNDNYGYPGDISFDDGVPQKTDGTFYECFPVENSRGVGLVVGFPPGSVLAQLADCPGKERVCSRLLVRQATSNRQEAIDTMNDPNPVNRKVYVGSQAIAPGGGAIELKVPSGGYVIYGYQFPEASRVAFRDAITFRQNGGIVPRMTILRTDGKDGDVNFNPIYPFKYRGSVDQYGNLRRGTNVGPRTYAIDVPVITNSQFDIEIVTDASTVNTLVKMDGGIDLNSHLGIGPTNGFDRRDNKPGTATDIFLGYEQAKFAKRCGPEKFASTNVAYNAVVSTFAETYYYTVGGASGIISGAGGGASITTATAGWVYHNPSRPVSAVGYSFSTQRVPYQAVSNQDVEIWIKVGYQFNIDRCYVYYTTDGSNPEGSFGVGTGSTRIAQGVFMADDSQDGTIDWWKAIIPAQSNGTTVKYKIGLYKNSISPISDADVAKLYGLTQFSINGFNPASAVVWVHNNLNTNHTRIGLEEGYHIVRARAFLPRDGKSSVFNTFIQTFYYDATPPQGEIVYPSTDGEILRSREYGVVVRTDETTTLVEYNIIDNDPNNDDAATGYNNGNGMTNNAPIFVKAREVTPTESITRQFSNYPKEFRFSYLAVPSSGKATITVRLYEATSGIIPNRVRELRRRIFVSAPPQNMFVAFPSSDSETIMLDRNDIYTIVARFSESLTSNITNFSIYINGSFQPRYSAAGLAVYYFYDQLPGDGMKELRFDWKNMAEGENLIEVRYNDGAIALQASRIVKVKFSGATVSFVAPPYFDEYGNHPFTIVLPMKPDPLPEERRYDIVVETDLQITNLYIGFNPPMFVGGWAVPDLSFQSSSSKRWVFGWTNLTEGTFTILATAYSFNTITETQQVKVVFKSVDTDSDGLPDDWEVANGLGPRDPTGQNGASGDPDNDGFSNIEEYIAGTDPKDSNSLLKIISLSASIRRIEWLSVPGKSYNVLGKEDIDLPFTMIASNILATNTSTFYIDTQSSGRRFYRIEVQKN